jgi:hypothetical protein
LSSGKANRVRDRREQALKLGCLILAALLALQLVRFVIRGDPVRRLAVPALPSLPAEAKTAETNTTAKAKGTNAAAEKMAKKGTGTNAVIVKNEGTNSASDAATMAKSSSATNLSKELAASTTNVMESHEKATNRATAGLTESPGPKGADDSTNNVTHAVPGKAGSNELAKTATSKTNAASSTNQAKKKGTGREIAKKGEVPPEIKDRVERVTQSEILGQVMHPLPMGLLGIAGDTAFLRSPDGQTGNVKEGEKVGAIKLLRIGINRVLIEQDGEKKELTMFEGLGGESLLPTKENTTNEVTRTASKKRE